VSAVVRGWSGVAAPPAIWILVQQSAGELIYTACNHAGPPWGPMIGLAGAAICAGVGWAAWTGRKAEGTPVDWFLCRAGAGMGAIFALACLVVSAATLMTPPCVR
jgi:hypothetical protein